jgi:nitrate reductase gamma subunit
MRGDVIYGRWPYVAATLAAGVFIVRFILAGPRLDALREEVAEARSVFAGTRTWRVGACLSLALHFAILAFPRAVLGWNSSALRLYLLEGTGFLVGATLIGAWTEVMWRHLTRKSPSTKSALADSFFLGVLFVALASGFLMQTAFRWASSWGAATLAPYVASLLRANPSIELVDQMPLVVRLHVISSFAALVLFPFSRASLLPVALLHRMLASALGPIGRALAWAETHVKGRAQAWIWTDDDTDPDIAPPDAWIPGRSGIVRSRAEAIEGLDHALSETFHESMQAR